MPELDLIPRSIRPLIIEGIEYSRIVFVAGARQVGKTTLVGDIATHEWPMTAVTLDDRATREAASSDPAGFVAGLEGRVFIDEIHRAPDLLLELKKAVDADTTPGRFVITGSANVLASRRIQDALHADYAYFMLGLSNYYHNLGVFERIFTIDLATRDLTQVKKSFEAFSTIVKVYPQSPYAPAAHQYMVYLRGVLANHELEVAQYYYNRKAYVAAADRANTVVELFKVQQRFHKH